jgi:hypothetical protein
MPRDLEAVEAEALLTDHYLDSLLSARDEGPVPTFAFGPGLAGLDRGVRIVSLRLQRDLPRFRPSTVFEERLALRLAQAAATLKMARAAGADGPAGRSAVSDEVDAELAHLVPGGLEAPMAARSVVRPALIGGAVASAAISVVVATLLARRRQQRTLGAGTTLVRQLARTGRILELSD